MVEDRNAPERPRLEPEIIPPDRGRSKRAPSFAQMDGVHRVYITRLGPFGSALLMLAIIALAAVVLLAFLGALLISIPLVVFLVIVVALSGLLRLRRG